MVYVKEIRVFWGRSPEAREHGEVPEGSQDYQNYFDIYLRHID